MVGFLQTRHRVTFSACALILACLGLIFGFVSGDLIWSAAMPFTLTTIFLKLSMKDNFIVHPICFSCHQVFDTDIPPTTFCLNCDEEVFGGGQTDHFNASAKSHSDAGHSTNPRSSSAKRPSVVAPLQLLSTGLRDFFERPGMISAVNAWKNRSRIPGLMASMQDGNVWKTIKGPDGNRFFFGAQADREIRLGVTFSLDWCVQQIRVFQI